jgi:DNA-binding response OmpR family regulator
MENARIVVVDDHPFIVDILSQILTREGYTVASASDGREGLTLIQKIQPDLVLIDWSLPGLGGIDVIKQLRATGNRLRIITITANASARYTALHYGSDDFLTKPFHLKEIVRLVKTWSSQSLSQTSQ